MGDGGTYHAGEAVVLALFVCAAADGAAAQPAHHPALVARSPVAHAAAGAAATCRGSSSRIGA